MKSVTLKKLFTLHSWVGILTAILLFIIAFTGAVAVLARPEIKIWSNEQLHTAPTVDMDVVSQLVNQYQQQVPEAFRDNIHVYFPSGHQTHLLTLIYESHDGDEQYDTAVAHVYQFSPDTYTRLQHYYGPTKTFYENRKQDVGSFIGEFHADLHLGEPLGLILTGVMGLTLLVSAVTGLVIHRRYFRELFTFRRKKSRDVWVTDAHKLVGLWGSLFHIVIGFTGAFLGLATVILLPAAAFVSFNGDQDKLIEAFTAMPEPVISQTYEPTQLSQIVHDAEGRYPDARILNATLMAHNDANAVVYLRTQGGTTVGSKLLKYKGDATFIKAMSSLGDIPGVSVKVLDLLFPLHFGNFGGIFIKLLWVTLGLATAVLPISGTMMWLSKRTRGQTPSVSRCAYGRWNRLIIGTCGGLVLACCALFPLQIVLNALVPPQAHNGFIGPVFFYGWLLWCAVALIPQPHRRFWRQFCAVLALLCLSVAPLHIALGSSHLLNGTRLLVSVFDGAFLAIGFAVLLYLRYNRGAANNKEVTSC